MISITFLADKIIRYNYRKIFPSHWKASKRRKNMPRNNPTTSQSSTFETSSRLDAILQLLQAKLPICYRIIEHRQPVLFACLKSAGTDRRTNHEVYIVVPPVRDRISEEDRSFEAQSPRRTYTNADWTSKRTIGLRTYVHIHKLPYVSARNSVVRPLDPGVNEQRRSAAASCIH